MTTAALDTRGRRGHVSPWLVAWLVVIALTVLLYQVRDFIPWAFDYPKALEWPLRFWISDFMKWLINDATFGLFTFKELTRSVAWLLDWPLTAATSLFSSGLMKGQGSDAVQLAPPPPRLARRRPRRALVPAPP